MIKALVIGEESSLIEVKQKLGDNWNLTHLESIDESTSLEEFDLIIDFVTDAYPEHYTLYSDLKDTLILFNGVRISLSELKFTFGEASSEIYGFNGLPGFFNREILEISSVNKSEGGRLREFGFDFVLVDDRVGLVTPRVITMIINEAYYTVQEGTASKKDIDLGMKLGTNYPMGPFEWAESIGIQEVYETLEAIYEDTRDERYKIAPLLKKEYLNQ